MCVKKKSGFVHSGCDCGKGQRSKSQKSTIQGQPSNDPRPSTSDLQPSTQKTEKDAIEEAKKYSNTEVPTHNKVFGITILIVTVMVLNGGKKDEN